MENLNNVDSNVALENLIKLREKINSECQTINERISSLLESSSSEKRVDSEFISLSKELFALHEIKSNELTRIDNVISSVLEINYNKQENASVSSFVR